MSDHDEGLRDENANQERNKGKDEAQYSARNCESGANSSCGAGNVGRMNDLVFLSKEMVTPYRWCPLLVNRPVAVSHFFPAGVTQPRHPSHFLLKRWPCITGR
jgi:hypothetical protein